MQEHDSGSYLTFGRNGLAAEYRSSPRYSTASEAPAPSPNAAIQGAGSSNDNREVSVSMFSPIQTQVLPLVGGNRQNRGRWGGSMRVEGGSSRQMGFKDLPKKASKAVGDTMRWKKEMSRWLDDVASLFYLSARLQILLVLPFCWI